MTVRRISLALVLAVIVALLPGACAPLELLSVNYRPAVQPAVVLPGDDASAASIAASERLLEASDVVFLASAGHADDLSGAAVAAGAPLLVAGDGIAAELERLERVELDPAVPSGEQDLPAIDVRRASSRTSDATGRAHNAARGNT